MGSGSFRIAFHVVAYMWVTKKNGGDLWYASLPFCQVTQGLWSNTTCSMVNVACRDMLLVLGTLVLLALVRKLATWDPVLASTETIGRCGQDRKVLRMERSQAVAWLVVVAVAVVRVLHRAGAKAVLHDAFVWFGILAVAKMALDCAVGHWTRATWVQRARLFGGAVLGWQWFGWSLPYALVLYWACNWLLIGTFTHFACCRLHAGHRGFRRRYAAGYWAMVIVLLLLWGNVGGWDVVLQACWNALQHATFGNGDADSGGISLDHSGADEALALVWNRFMHAYHGNPVLETEVVLCRGCGRADEELLEPSCLMHIQGVRMVAPVLVTDGQLLPCGSLNLLPCAIRAAHLAGFHVYERYRLSKTAYCRDCSAWFGRDSVRKTYLSLWAHSWPSVTAYLLGPNVKCDVWRVLPPTVRMQWRGLLHPSRAALPLLLDTIRCASDDFTLSTYHRVASLMGSAGTKCAICRTGLCDDEV